MILLKWLRDRRERREAMRRFCTHDMENNLDGTCAMCGLEFGKWRDYSCEVVRHIGVPK
jgi:hypothetical protein